MKMRIAFAAAALLASCGGGRAPETAAANAFTVLAGSELKDVETHLKSEIRSPTGLDLAFTYSGTLDAVGRLAGGERLDGLWVAYGKDRPVESALKDRIVAQEKTTLSPVLLGVKK